MKCVYFNVCVGGEGCTIINLHPHFLVLRVFVFWFFAWAFSNSLLRPPLFPKGFFPKNNSVESTAASTDVFQLTRCAQTRNIWCLKENRAASTSCAHAKTPKKHPKSRPRNGQRRTFGPQRVGLGERQGHLHDNARHEAKITSAVLESTVRFYFGSFWSFGFLEQKQKFI